jgi:hypothetical protein
VTELLYRDEAADRRMAERGRLVEYLPWILRYPLSGHALPALLLFTGLVWIGAQNLMGVVLLGLVSPWILHYAEAVIDRTAMGQSTPPQFGGDMIFLGSVRAFRPVVGVGLVAAAAFALGWDDPVRLALVLVTGALLFPAFLLVLAVENRLVAALNPLRLLAVMAGVGPAYLGVCAVLALATAGATLVSGAASMAATLLVSMYAFVLTCHLLGYVAYHRAERLGLSVRTPAVTDESRRMEEQNERLARVLRGVDAALAQGDSRGAWGAVCAEPGGPADPRLFHEELFEQMQRRRRPELVHAQGQRLISLLIREKRIARALEIAETCYDTHRAFDTAEPAEAVILAEAALQLKREGLFERLTHDAAGRYPDHPAAVSLAFLAAKFWYEQRRDAARARSLIEPLLGHTAHPQHRQIAAYARALTLAAGSDA